jgi:hypothetical protein
VSRLKIVLGQTLGRATVALIQGAIVFLVCLAAGFRPAQPLLLPLALLFMALIAIMCTAIGTAFGSVLQDMQGFQLIINFIVLPLFLFSSALFPVPDLPGAMRVVVWLNPLSYGVDAVCSPAVSCSASRPTSRSLAASPRSYSRSVLTCSQRSRCSRRPDDQFSHLTVGVITKRIHREEHNAELADHRIEAGVGKWQCHRIGVLELDRLVGAKLLSSACSLHVGPRISCAGPRPFFSGCRRLPDRRQPSGEPQPLPQLSDHQGWRPEASCRISSSKPSAIAAPWSRSGSSRR